MENLASGHSEKTARLSRQTTANRLTTMSIESRIDPRIEFDWPESLPEDVLWMPEKLMSIHGTAAGKSLSEEQIIRLSKWESIWFYSFNVHGERHLLRDVLECMHTPGYEDISEYMHHFVAEENLHSWFFSTFCRRYGGKVYTDKRVQFQANQQKAAVNAFLVFARILILEEMLDYYNVIIAADESIPAIIRKLNSVHHFEESRHMAFGRSVVTDLYGKVQGRGVESDIEYCRTYIERYFEWCLDALYNPEMYRDAGIANAYDFRNAVMKDPARSVHHDALVARVKKFFAKIGVIG